MAVILIVGHVAPLGDNTKFWRGHRKMTENLGATVTFQWATILHCMNKIFEI